MRSQLLAALASIVVQLPLFGFLVLLPQMAFGGFDSGDMAFYAAAVSITAGAAVMLLGLPVFALLRHAGRADARAVALAGLLIGGLPVAVMGWPFWGLYGGYSSGGVWLGHAVDLYRNGSPTLYAWLDYFVNMVRLGLQGLLGGMVFFWVWRRVG